MRGNPKSEISCQIFRISQNGCIFHSSQFVARAQIGFEVLNDRQQPCTFCFLLFAFYYLCIMQNIKNIILDYGNVIFLIDFMKTQHTFTELGIENVETFFAHTGHDPLFDEFEMGKISAADFRDGVRRITNIPRLTDKQIDHAWNTLLIGVPPVNHEILLKLKKKYRTFLLSNNNEIHYKWIMDYLEREFNVDSNAIFFEKDYYSHLMGKRKPNADIFEQVIDENQLDPAETLFIDDSPQHLRTAEKLGFQTFLMKPDDSLEMFVKRSGLLEGV